MPSGRRSFSPGSSLRRFTIVLRPISLRRGEASTLGCPLRQTWSFSLPKFGIPFSFVLRAGARLDGQMIVAAGTATGADAGAGADVEASGFAAALAVDESSARVSAGKDVMANEQPRRAKSGV